MLAVFVICAVLLSFAFTIALEFIGELRQQKRMVTLVTAARLERHL